ncbi:MAG: hypothetical protein HZC29_01210 [Thaumarchaeota archaeon]|nr:hypothetical protein [Nitrososphaerota archaeon]
MSDITDTTENIESVKTPVCSICSQEKCICNEFICPQHGRVKAKPDGKTSRKISGNDPKNPQKVIVNNVEYDNYSCSIEGCDTKRILPEMEYPHRNE